MSGFRLGKLSATKPTKPPKRRPSFGRRMCAHALTTGGIAILAMGSELLSSPVASAHTLTSIPASGAVPLLQDAVPVVDAPIPGLVPVIPPGLIPGLVVPPPPEDEPPGPGQPPPGLIPGPGACSDVGGTPMFRFEVCVAHPEPLDLGTRLEVRLNVPGVSLSSSDARYFSLASILATGGCNVGFALLGDSLTQSDADPTGTTNSSTADGLLSVGFTEATFISPLPSNSSAGASDTQRSSGSETTHQAGPDSGPPAVGGALGLAAAPLGHTDTTGDVTRRGSDGDAHAAPLGLAVGVP